MKKLFFLFLALVATTTLWAEDFSVGGFYYNYLDGNNVEVTYRGSSFTQYDNEYSGAVAIPSTVTYNGTTYSVTSIGWGAFQKCSSLTSVTIGNNVMSIGNYAFNNCSRLTSVTIPNSVTSIGDDAFSYCSSLKSITIPNSVTSIGDDAFSSCSRLTSITIGNSVTSIGDDAFYDCSKLTSVTINSDAIVNKTYSYSSNISDIFGSQVTEYIIGDDVKGIGYAAFYACSSLTSITIPNSVTSIGTYAFRGCSSLTSVTIPNSVTSIGGWAFYECSSLTSITIPNSVTTIGEAAFSGTNITSIAWNAKKCDNLPLMRTTGGNSFNYIFGNSEKIKYFVFGDSVEHIPSNLCYDMYNLTTVTIPNSVTTIGKGAFDECSSLTSIVIPENVTHIDGTAFFGCDDLTSVIWNAKKCADFSYSYSPSGSIIYGPFFKYNGRISSFILGDSVEHIPSYLCYEMSSLSSITIPNSVTSIGSSAFFGCSSLTSVVWNAENCADFSSYSVAPFYDIRSQITSFTFGDSVLHIPSYLCYRMSNLTSITVPNSVTSIGDNAFRYCSSLTSPVYNAHVFAFLPTTYSGAYTINDGITSIAGGAFAESSSLTSITIPCSVMKIGKGAFDKCSLINIIIIKANNLEELCKNNVNNQLVPADIHLKTRKYIVNNEDITDMVVPESIESINSYALYGCSSLISISIPNTVTNIGESAFYDCTSLREISLGSRIKNIDKNAFGNCYRLYEITCYAQDPPVADLTSFANYDAYFHVPCNALRYYNVDPVWKNFHNIECLDTDDTMIENTNIQSPITDCQKFIRDGQLLILRDGVEYNAMGAQIQ